MSTIDLNLGEWSTGAVMVDGVDVAKTATEVIVRATAGRQPVVEITHQVHVGGRIEDGQVRTLVYMDGYQGEGDTVREALADLLNTLTVEESMAEATA